MRAMALTAEDFHVSGPLQVVPEADQQYMPIKDPHRVWLDVNLWKPYYSPDYERGNPELFVKCAEWLEQRLPGCEIFYGHDVGEENLILFDGPAKRKLLANYSQSGGC